MIIFYQKPNILSLPFKVIRKIELRDKDNKPILDDEGKPKLIDKDFAEYFKFVPGKNSISKELWLKIVEYNKEDMDYYSTVLTIFKPKIDEETEEEIGEDDENINIKELNAREMKDLVENTMTIGDLVYYEKTERERDKPRKTILNALRKQKDAISAADEAFSGKEE